MMEERLDFGSDVDFRTAMGQNWRPQRRKARVFKFRSSFGRVARPWHAWVSTGDGITAGRFQSQHATWQEAMDWVHGHLASAT